MIRSTFNERGGAHSAADLALTLSSGKSFSIDSLIRTVATTRHDIAVQWADENVRHLGENTAIVTSRSTESEGLRSSTYRYTTFLRKSSQGWIVIAAHSTRLNEFTARSTTFAQLADFEGEYTVIYATFNARGLTLCEPVDYCCLQRNSFVRPSVIGSLVNNSDPGIAE